MESTLCTNRLSGGAINSSSDIQDTMEQIANYSFHYGRDWLTTQVCATPMSASLCEAMSRVCLLVSLGAANSGR